MHHLETIKTIAKVYLSNRECPVQKAVYHNLPELKLRKIFLAICFVNVNAPEERIQVLVSEKELSELPDDSSNIFKKSNNDYYLERPSATFLNGKYSILDDFCYAQFLAYYTFENKSSKTGEYQQIENNYEECPYR